MMKNSSKLESSLRSLSAIESPLSTIKGNTDVIQQYQSAVKNLSTEQAVHALASKNVNAAQIEEILTTKTATLETNSYTDANVKAALAKQNLASTTLILSTEQQKEIINSGLLSSEKMAEIASVLGLTTAENGSLVSKEALNAATIKEKLESIGVVGANQAQIISLFGLTSAEGGAITGTNLLTASFSKLWAVIAANPITATVIALGALTAGIFAIQKHAQKVREETRKESMELTNSFQDRQSSLNPLIEKYEELAASLKNGSLSASEARSAKEQLLDIQQSLIDTYGEEASHIDLVNGEYETQIELLKTLSKQDAADYVIENRKAYNDATRALEEIRSYTLTTSIKVDDQKNAKTKSDQKLLNYLEEYTAKNDLLTLNYKDLASNYNGTQDSSVTISVNADVRNADAAIREFEKNLKYFGEKAGIVVEGILTNTSGQLESMWTDELTEYKTIYHTFLQAEILEDDTLRSVYIETVDDVENYNNALASGEDVEDNYQKLQAAKNKAKKSIQNTNVSPDEKERMQAFYDDIFDNINKDSETGYQIGQKLENDQTIKKYAEQLRNLKDTDLQSIDLDHINYKKGEEPFQELMRRFNLENYQSKILIDKLVEHGLVQKDLSDELPDETVPLSDRFKNLWDSAAFQSAKDELSDLGKKAALTEKDILSLAEDNSELAAFLKDTGMSAQFAASCFNDICSRADGFSAITDDALALDQVLHGMDESLQNVAESKSEYDLAMQEDDYNADFMDYQKAYQNAMEMFENGEFGKHFRSTMQYLLGDDSLTMSIDEMYAKVQGMGSIFGKNADNGMGFLDRLYEHKDALNGMDSSLEKRADGTYDFDLKPEEFSKIGEAVGMTTEAVTACVYALGMFGNFRPYDLEEVAATLTGISIAAKDGEQSILSLQSVQDLLSDQYSDYDIQSILQDIQGMEQISLLDFGVEDTESLQAIIDKLKELNLIEINGGLINAESLTESLQTTFGMAKEDIEKFLASLNDSGFQFEKKEKDSDALPQNKKSIPKEQTSDNPSDKNTASSETVNDSVNDLSDGITSLNNKTTENITNQFNVMGGKIGDVDRKVLGLSWHIDEINSKKISLPDFLSASVQKSPEQSEQKTKGKNSKKTGKSSASGNIQIGSSYAAGTIGAIKTETALINELGNETIIDPKSGTYEIVNGGAQFRKIKKGQIILNHLQTKALQKYGKISSFGKMLFSGSAKIKGSSYLVGTANRYTFGGSSDSSPGNANSNTNSAASPDAKDAEKPFEQFFNWLERRLKNLQRVFDKWIKQAETALTGKMINKYYKKAAGSMKKELNTYGKSYDFYMGKARETGLSETYAKKVRNGTLDPETVTDEDLAEQIGNYQEWYDKAIESTTSFLETAEKLYNLPLEKAAAKIELFKDAISLLDKKLGNAIGHIAKNSLIDQKTAQEKKTLNTQKKAKKESKKNLKRAAKDLKSSDTLKDSGLTAKEKKKLKKRVTNRKEIDISSLKEGSKAYNSAVKYNEALKAKKQSDYDLKMAAEDYNAWLVEAAKAKFDNIANDYEKEIKKLDYKMTAVNNEISEIEAAGKIVNVSYYGTQKSLNDQMLAKYQAEKSALEKSITGIKEGTDEWYSAYDQIRQIDSAISGCKKETYALNNAIQKLHFDLFDDIAESIGRIITEQEFLQGLTAHEKTTDDKTGSLTDAGYAKLGSSAASYYAAKNRADKDAAMVKELQEMVDKGVLSNGKYTFNSIDDLEAKLKEMYSKWQGDIKETYSKQSAVVDMMKEQYKAQLAMVKDLIDAKKKALNTEKDLHNYQKSIQEKTDNISTIKKQIAAYSGDTSQEGLAKLQKLQKELVEKQNDLKETEYDRYLSDQQELLDKLYEEYDELTTKKMDDFMGLFQEGINLSNDNTSRIADYLSGIAESNGYIEQTKGLFDGLSDSIEKNVNLIIDSIVNKEIPKSGTVPDEQGNAGKDSQAPAAQTTSSSANTGNGGSSSSASSSKDARQLDLAMDFIAGRLKNREKTKKDKSDYGAVNKIIYENKSNLYKGKGKVLKHEELIELADLLGVKYNNNKKSGNLYQKLKSIKFPGFKKGGIVSVDDIARQVDANGDDGIASVKNGEGFISAKQMPQIQNLLNKLPEMNQISQTLSNLPDLCCLAASDSSRIPGSIAASYHFTLENCTNAEDIIRQIQQSKKVQNALRSVTLDRLADGGRLSVRSIQ